MNEPEDPLRIVDDEPGLSLEELSQTYAQLISQGREPYQESVSDQPVAESPSEEIYDPLENELLESDDCPITPHSIVEAALFLGHPENEPLTAEMLAGLMRGVRPAEVDQIVVELNEQYRASHLAMEVISAGGGYRMELARDLHPLRDRFYGRVKESRLNQAAIDILALVGYQPGIDRAQLEMQWGKPAGAMISQLIRRKLLEIRREGKGKTRRERFYPTQRFLELFGINSLEDLPVVDDAFDDSTRVP